MNDMYPSLLERMERGNSPRDLQPQAMKGVVIQEASMEMDRPWHKNPSISWMTSLRNSGAKTSRNSRRYPTSSLSSTLIHQDQSEQKTLRSNITQRRSTKSMPLLLQRFSEVNTPNEDYSAPEIPTSEQTMSGINNTMPLSTTYCPKSATIPSEQGDLSPKILSTTTIPIRMTSTLAKSSPTRSEEFMNQRCHGSPEKRKLGEPEIKTAKNLEEPSLYSLETTKPLSSGFRLPEQHLLDSRVQSGTTSSEGKLSISMPCSPHCTIYPLLKRTLDAWDQLKSPSVDQSLLRKSK